MTQLSLDFADPLVPVATPRSTRRRREAARARGAVAPDTSTGDVAEPVALPMPDPITDLLTTMNQAHASSATDPNEDAPDITARREDRLWQLDGWTARVIKNEDDDGWAVAMYQDGEPEPALVGPWTMGRDKKNPKPLDQAAFNTLVKTASEVLQRHEQQRHAALHKRQTVFALDRQWEVRLDIVPDEYEPHALLSALDDAGEEVACIRVRPDFRLGSASATAWIEDDFRRPRGQEE